MITTPLQLSLHQRLMPSVFNFCMVLISSCLSLRNGAEAKLHKNKKNIKNLTRCRDSRWAKSIETRDDSIKQFSIQLHHAYISFHIKDNMVGGVLNCFMLSTLACFYAFCWSAIPTSCYILMFLFLFVSLFLIFSSRCMLELIFAIYYRAASLPSQASYAVLAEETLTRPGFLQTLPAHQQYS